MTQKAQSILRKLKEQERRKVLRRMQRPEVRDQNFLALNEDTLDTTSRVGGDQEMKILRDMNEFNDQHEQVLKEMGQHFG